MLRKLVIGAAAAGGLALGAGAALADGMPRAPAYQANRGCANWAGVYVGGHAGAAWAKTDWHWINDNYFADAGDRSKIDPFSYIAGVHGGVQHQWGCFVAGLEATYSAGDITKDIASPFFPTLDTHSASLSRVTTVTGRLGYSAGDWLLYGKGGYAGARVELFAQTNFLPGFGDAQSQSDQWHNGWTVGTGFEVQLGSALGKSMIFGLEYNYIDLGSRSHTLACVPAGCFGPADPIVNADVNMHVVTARLTFLLGREPRVEAFK